MYCIDLQRMSTLARGSQACVLSLLNGAQPAEHFDFECIQAAANAQVPDVLPNWETGTESQLPFRWRGQQELQEVSQSPLYALSDSSRHVCRSAVCLSAGKQTSRKDLAKVTRNMHE